MKEQQVKETIDKLNEVIKGHVPDNIKFVSAKSADGKYFATLDMQQESPEVIENIYLINAVLLNNYRKLSEVCKLVTKRSLQVDLEKILDIASESLSKERIALMKNQLSNLKQEYEKNGLIRINIRILNLIIQPHCGKDIRFIAQEIDNRLEFYIFKFVDKNPQSKLDLNRSKITAINKYLKDNCGLITVLDKEQLSIPIGLLNANGWNNAIALSETQLEIEMEQSNLQGFINVPFDFRKTVRDAERSWDKTYQGLEGQPKQFTLTIAQQHDSKNEEKANKAISKNDQQAKTTVPPQPSGVGSKGISFVTKVLLGNPLSLKKSF